MLTFTSLDSPGCIILCSVAVWDHVLFPPLAKWIFNFTCSHSIPIPWCSFSSIFIPIPAFSDSDRSTPGSLAVEGDYIYWTDTFYNSITRARRIDGNEQLKIRDRLPAVSDIKVIKNANLNRRSRWSVNVVDYYM